MVTMELRKFQWNVPNRKRLLNMLKSHSPNAFCIKVIVWQRSIFLQYFFLIQKNLASQKSLNNYLTRLNTDFFFRKMSVSLSLNPFHSLFFERDGLRHFTTFNSFFCLFWYNNYFFLLLKTSLLLIFNTILLIYLLYDPVSLKAILKNDVPLIIQKLSVHNFIYSLAALLLHAQLMIVWVY